MDTIGELPFLLQRHIMEFRPRLPYLPNKQIILQHLEKKYCKICGEYIDMPYYKTRPAPVHLHYGRKKYKQDLYVSIDPTDFELFPYNIMARKKRMLHEGIFSNVRIVFKICRPRYFYNMKRVLRKRSFRMTLMENIASINIFSNPNFTLFTEPDMVYTAKPGPPIFLNSIEHKAKITRLFIELGQKYPTFLEDVSTTTDLLLDYQYVLDGLLQEMPHTILNHLIGESFYPDYIFKDIIKKNVSHIEYFTEDKLNELFSKDKDFFFDLRENVPTAADYFYFHTLDIP